MAIENNLRYNLTPPTLADGQYGGFQLDSSGNLKVTNAGSAIVPGTAATNLGKAEDAVHASGDTGVMALAVRADTAAATGANGDYVPLLTDGEGKLHVNSSAAYSASATFTPAAASHVAGDVHGGVQQFSTVGPSGGRVMITSATLEIDGGTAEATAWRLALFSVTPPSALADDAAFTLPSGDRASFLGFVNLGTAIDEVDTQWVETHGINKQIKLASANVFGYLINGTTLTPAAVAHIVTIHTVTV